MDGGGEGDEDSVPSEGVVGLMQEGIACFCYY